VKDKNTTPLSLKSIYTAKEGEYDSKVLHLVFLLFLRKLVSPHSQSSSVIKLREYHMEKSSHQLLEDIDILDLRSSVQEILREYDEEHKNVLKVHDECNEGEMSMDEYMKFASMLGLLLLSPTLTEESMDTSTTSCLGEAESTCM
jgi:hypothetical protein